MQRVARLAELNEIDLAVDASKARLAEIAEALKEPTVLKAARAALARAEKDLAAAQSRQRECEVAQAKGQAKLADDEKKLYSGKVTNPKELSDQQANLDQSRRQLAHCEDELLAALIAVEEATAAHETAAETVARLAAAHASSQVTLREELARLQRRLAADQARQAAARANVPPALLSAYDTLRARRGGRAVAPLEGDTCGVCLVAVSPTVVDAALKGEELVYCENCGRLLFAE